MEEMIVDSLTAFRQYTLYSTGLEVYIWYTICYSIHTVVYYSILWYTVHYIQNTLEYTIDSIVNRSVGPTIVILLLTNIIVFCGAPIHIYCSKLTEYLYYIIIPQNSSPVYQSRLQSTAYTVLVYCSTHYIAPVCRNAVRSPCMMIVTR